MTIMLGSVTSEVGVNFPSEENDYDYDYDYDYDEYTPISTPFLTTSSSSNHDIHNSILPNKPPMLTFLMSALRKSFNCSVDTHQQVSSSSSSSSSLDLDLDIGRPTDVEHVSHVTFDRFNGFLGLPLEFQPDLPPKVPSASTSVFGVSPLSMQCSTDERGNNVPTILLMMQNCLYQQGGLQAEGIFRVTADNSQEVFLRNQLNKGLVPEGIDVHCLAALIKAWFRELPEGVLDSITGEEIMNCNTEEECNQVVKLLPPTEAALLDWTINLMADVVYNEHHNKMDARNIAMVFAPNMTQMADPLTALLHAVQIMNFLRTLIVRTLRLRQESATEARLLSSYAPDSFNPTTNMQHPPPISIGDLLFDEKHPNFHPLEFNPKQMHRTNDDEEKQRVCFSGDKSQSNKQQSRESRILDRLNFRKGVKKLCKHPVFHLNKPAKKIAELEVVDK